MAQRIPARPQLRHTQLPGGKGVPDPTNLFAETTLATKQFETAVGTRSFNRGYYRIDLGGSYQIWGRLGIMERAELIARFNNVTDERYTEVLGFPAPPVNAMVGVRVTFN